jgi:DNA-binding IclR family transcriptional regulator
LRDLAPANATAGGKLLLAYREPWRDVVLASPLTALTERTLAEPRALRAELERARERGYATEDGEYRRGVRALALPVRAGGDEVVAALAVSSADSVESLLERADRVVAAADELSERLQREAA